MVKAIWQVITVSAAVHILLVVYSLWHDRSFQFKYTDVDYWVFSDAARAVAAGLSPFARATYRYTPLLAFVLLPGQWLGQEAIFGKLLFSLFDLLVGFLIYRLLRLKGWHSVDAARQAALFWLLNPMALAISTRGNAESLVCACVLGVVYLLMVRRRMAAAILFGFSVHFKLFPVIFAPAIILFLGIYHRTRAGTGALAVRSPAQGTARADEKPAGASGLSGSHMSLSRGVGMGVKLSSSPLLLRSASPHRLTESISGALGESASLAALPHRPQTAMARSVVSRMSQVAGEGDTGSSAQGTRVVVYPPSRVLLSLGGGVITVKSSHVVFVAVSVATFVLLTGGFYLLYGRPFIREALLHHLFRKDHRHNFSPYFLPFYLEAVTPLPRWLHLVAFVPQLAMLLTVAFKYARKDLPFACFLQTFLFVTFNKVCTSQVN